MAAPVEFLPFHINYLTEEMIERAEEELNETSKLRKQALSELRRDIEKKLKLNCSFDDNHLLQFLRARKFNLQRTLEIMQNYYTAKKNYKDVFEKTDFESVMKVCSEKLVIALPYRDVDGAIIVLINFGYWNPAEMSFATLIHTICTIALCCVDLHPATQICGLKMILDVKGLGINHLLHTSPRLLHIVARGISDLLPIRYPAFHIFNESFVIKYAWNLIKFVCSPKIRKRVHFHGPNPESLHTQVNPALLPESLGGTLVYDNNPWMKTVKDFEQRYFELMSFGFNSET